MTPLSTSAAESCRSCGHRGLPGFTDTTAAAINARGDIVLTMDSTSSTTHADAFPYDAPHIALYKNGTLIDLGPGYASGLNDTGEVSGYVYTDAHGDPRPSFVNAQDTRLVSALILTADKRIHLGEGMTTAINNRGTVIGLSGGLPTAQGYSFGKAFPVRWQQGTKKRLEVTAPSEAPAAINAPGQIVGGSRLWQNARQYSLNRLIPSGSGWKKLQANAINSRGQIAGMGLFRGKSRAFLMTPTK